MTVETPSLLDGVSVASKDFRRMLHAALGAAPGSFAGGIGALDGAAHGVCGPGHLAVSQSGTPAMSVDVAAGLAIIRPTSSAALGPFPFYNDAPVTLAVSAAHATLARKDLVIAEIRTASTPRLAVVAGTPAASPADPSLAATPDCLVLARIDVPAADTSITNSQITDLRTPAGRWAQPWGRVATARTSSQQTGISTGPTDVTSLSVTFTAVAGRRYRLAAELSVQQITSAGTVTLTLADGSNTVIQRRTISLDATYAAVATASDDVTPAAGSITYKVRLGTSAGTVTSRPSGTDYQWLTVDDVGPV